MGIGFPRPSHWHHGRGTPNLEPSPAGKLARRKPVPAAGLRRAAPSGRPEIGSRKAGAETLQPTALVHEAYLRFVGTDHEGQHWDSRGHFFVAAAEAIRRILVERAQSRATLKRGGKIRRLDLDQIELICNDRSHELLALDEALGELEYHDSQAAQLVKLRYYAGLTHQQAAEALGISRRAADRLWVLARAWLYQQISE